MSAPDRTGQLPGVLTTIAPLVRPWGGPTVPRDGTLVPIQARSPSRAPVGSEDMRMAADRAVPGSGPAPVSSGPSWPVIPAGGFSATPGRGGLVRVRPAVSVGPASPPELPAGFPAQVVGRGGEQPQADAGEHDVGDADVDRVPGGVQDHRKEVHEDESHERAGLPSARGRLPESPPRPPR